MTTSIAAEIRRTAASIGLDGIHIARIADFGEAAGEYLAQFVAAGSQGDMDWLANTVDRRRHPNRLWPEAKTAIVAVLNYGPDRDPLPDLQRSQSGVISVYAKGRDYHDILKPRLKQVARQVASLTGSDVKVFVDTAPLLEKPLAQLAGAGWQGKHTNLVSRAHGSWVFLGVVLTTAVIEPDPPEPDRCGSCHRCLDACPTAAFPAPFRLDPRRCIAYLSIEHKGPIDREFRGAMGNRIFGCDDCLAVCPWNKFATQTREMKLKARVETDNPPLADLLSLDDANFRLRFQGTPVKRTGRDRFLRNVLIAAGNAKNPSLVPQIESLLTDPSPLVRGAAVWALARLSDRERVRGALTSLRRIEQDQTVIAELEAEGIA